MASAGHDAVDDRAEEPVVDEARDAVEVGAPRSVVADFQLADPIVEYRLTCREHERPPLAMFVGAERALTCFGGVCYVLRR